MDLYFIIIKKLFNNILINNNNNIFLINIRIIKINENINFNN